MKAVDVLQPGETALVLFTRGELFTTNPDRSGETGNWRLDPQRVPDRVVIYRRGDTTDSNEVFIASCAGFRPSKEPGRLVLQLAKVSPAGTTHLNWRDFAQASSNPIRYVDRPRQ
jgi:hypothetical protein